MHRILRWWRHLLNTLEFGSLRVELPEVLSLEEAWARDRQKIGGDWARVGAHLEEAILEVADDDLIEKLRSQGPQGEAAIEWIKSRKLV